MESITWRSRAWSEIGTPVMDVKYFETFQGRSRTVLNAQRVGPYIWADAGDPVIILEEEERDSRKGAKAQRRKGAKGNLIILKFNPTDQREPTVRLRGCKCVLLWGRLQELSFEAFF